MIRQSNIGIFPRLKRIFEAEGPRAAITFLNSLCGLRFTSLYLFDKDTLRNITFFDREFPDVDTCEAIPILASYCVFIRDTGNGFATHNAKEDGRVVNHPKRETIQTYCGVPLLNRNGEMIGSACHFDFTPGTISDLDVELLEYMATLLQYE